MNNINCKQGLRQETLRQQRRLNGLDYLEVDEDQKTLNVFLLAKVPVQLDKTQIIIEGGRRIQNVKVLSVKLITAEEVEFDNRLEVKIDKLGDYSNYLLRVVEKNDQGDWRPHSQFDQRYHQLEFNFKVDCPNEFDCKENAICPEEEKLEPEINYLAKDYASFRQLIFDRLALNMPDWQESHVADIGVALVEVLAYVGDHLSYYQDAVATEAYLQTARNRISIRRHVRLVDYTMHEGCNARAWVCLRVDSDIAPIKAEQISFISGFDKNSSPVLKPEQLQQDSTPSYQSFQPVSNEDIILYQDHNRIQFYTWCDQQCCIPKGATSATLLGECITADQPPADVIDCKPEKSEISEDEDLKQMQQSVRNSKAIDIALVKLHLKPGDVLIFEEVIGPETGHPQDANPNHRHAVRIKTIHSDSDRLTGQPLTHITWCEEDALPFPLCLSVIGPAPECNYLDNVSIACANVVLVDHGASVEEDLEPVPEGEISICCKDVGLSKVATVTPAHYHPTLKFTPVTFCEAYDDSQPASKSLKQNVRRSVPKIKLSSDIDSEKQQQWTPRQDLLASTADDFDFVAELDNEGQAHLRFGNNEMGRTPEPAQRLHAQYRIGNGPLGNVGAEAISHVLLKQLSLDGIKDIRNPMPAQGGTAAEPISEVKLYAPQAFRQELQRAIIADDYAAIVLREFNDKVQNAVAKLLWNGSWYEVMLAVDPFGQEQADQTLLDDILQCLHRYRRIGHDLQVRPAQRVALDIELKICVLPDYLRGHVKAELLKIFSNQRYSKNKLGFFHPDKLTFGEHIYLSRLVAAAQSVEGVESVTVSKMQRWCEMPNDEIENGVLPLAPFEIARLDNDPSLQENGKLNLHMRGGR